MIFLNSLTLLSPKFIKDIIGIGAIDMINSSYGIYTNAMEDFTVTAVSGSNTFTISGAPFSIATLNIQAGGLLVNGKAISLQDATISGNTVTVPKLIPNLDTGDVVVATVIANPRTIDQGLDIQKTVDQNPIWNHYTDPIEIVSEQDLTTGSYVDFGSEIDMRTYNRLGVYVSYDNNNSTGSLIQVVGLDETGGTEFAIDGISSKTLTDEDQNIYYEFDKGTVPIVKVQGKSSTIGATPGDLTISINKIWRD